MQLSAIIKTKFKYHTQSHGCTIKIKDREGVVWIASYWYGNEHNNAYELPVEGTCGGMAMCASCQCYVLNDVTLPEMGEDEEAMLSEAFMWKQIVVGLSNTHHRKFRRIRARISSESY
jgi:2Fe-2S ferredoxin